MMTMTIRGHSYDVNLLHVNLRKKIPNGNLRYIRVSSPPPPVRTRVQNLKCIISSSSIYLHACVITIKLSRVVREIECGTSSEFLVIFTRIYRRSCLSTRSEVYVSWSNDRAAEDIACVLFLEFMFFFVLSDRHAAIR